MRTILWCAALLAVACGGDPAHGNSSAAPPAATAAVGMPTLTYFTMRGWMLCQKIEPMVDGLAKEYEGKMKFAVVPHNEGDSQQRIAALGLEIHGMAITDAAGNKLWTESGHKQQRDVVKQAIDAALAR